MRSGSQLQRPDDETPADDPLDIASMTREERDRLRRRRRSIRSWLSGSESSRNSAAVRAVVQTVVRRIPTERKQWRSLRTIADA